MCISGRATGLLAARDPTACTAVQEEAPMRCPCCDANNPDGSKFCIVCGGPLRPRCPRCGADNLPRAMFCRECGTSLTEQIPALYPWHSSPPLSYTSGHVVDKIVTLKSALEGERKQVTVLYADLQEAKALFKEVL
jgi:hypothetical protein